MISRSEVLLGRLNYHVFRPSRGLPKKWLARRTLHTEYMVGARNAVFVVRRSGHGVGQDTEAEFALDSTKCAGIRAIFDVTRLLVFTFL